MEHSENPPMINQHHNKSNFRNAQRTKQATVPKIFSKNAEKKKWTINEILNIQKQLNLGEIVFLGEIVDIYVYLL